MHPIERFYRQYRDDVYRYLLGLARDPNPVSYTHLDVYKRQVHGEAVDGGLAAAGKGGLHHPEKGPLALHLHRGCLLYTSGQWIK